MVSDIDADLTLQALFQEVLKLKKFYDGSSRCITQYEALANTIDGGPCLRTDYTYVGASTNVDAMKESMSAWDSSWDI